MSREKQIFGVDSITELPCWQGAKQCLCEVECEDCIESHLLAAGYRKQSEVAREIFEEIERVINNLEYQANTPRKTVKVEELKAQMDWVLHEVVPQMLAELKKKYTEERK